MFKLEITEPDKLFFTSDTHFGHFNISKYCHRPFTSRSNMDKSLIENWNSVVPSDGIVIHCGDFMLPSHYGTTEYMKYMSKLNGKIYLLRGNHDRIEITSNPVGYFAKLGDIIQTPKLMSVMDIMEIDVEDNSIMACHYPMLSYPANYQVFGHIHTLSDGLCHGLDCELNQKIRSTQYDVGVDQNEYKPISYRELMDIFSEKQKGDEK